MAYVLYKEYTKRFISYTDTGKVIHTNTLEKAYKFDSQNQARNARKKATKKMTSCKTKSKIMKQKSMIYKRN